MASIKEQKVNDKLIEKLEKKEFKTRKKIKSKLKKFIKNKIDRDTIVDNLADIIINDSLDFENDIIKFLNTMTGEEYDNLFVEINKKDIYKKINSLMTKIYEDNIKDSDDIMSRFVRDTVMDQLDNNIDILSNKKNVKFRVLLSSNACEQCINEAQNYQLTGVFLRHTNCQCGWERI